MKKHDFDRLKFDLRAGHIQLLITKIQSSFLFQKLLQNSPKKSDEKNKNSSKWVRLWEF